MLASLRASRLAALLVVLSLGLGVAAPALACGLTMGEAGAALDGMAARPDGAPCPMDPAAPRAPPPAAPAAADCCAATAPAAPATEKTARAPAAPVVALLVALALPAPAAAPAPVRAEALRPPAAPGPLHLLYGSFLI